MQPILIFVPGHSGILKCRIFSDVLLQYRRHPGQISSAKFLEQTKYADIIRINQLIDVLGFKLEEIPVFFTSENL